MSLIAAKKHLCGQKNQLCRDAFLGYIGWEYSIERALAHSQIMQRHLNGRKKQLIVAFLQQKRDLGVMYEKGEGVKASPEKAFLCYKDSAEQEDSIAQYYVG